MKIFVPIKSVIDVDLNIRVQDGKVVEDGMSFIISKWDETAVEAGLQLKEAVEGEVTVVSIGGGRTGESLRKALAMGADKAIHVDDPATVGSDSAGFAKILAKVLERESYDLVITGKQAQDTDMGATGALLAGLLDVPLVANVIKVEAQGDGQLLINRMGHQGQEVLEVKLPALFSANDSLNEPRLASLRGIMSAKKKPMEVLTLADLGLSAGDVGTEGARVKVLEFSPPKARAAGKKFEGDDEEITRQVMDLLANEAKIFA